MTSRPVQVTWTGAHQFDAGVATAPTIHLDGSAKAGPGPVDALLCALGSCTAIDVVDILAKRRTPVSALAVTIDSERVDTIPRRLKHVRLHYTITGAGIDRDHAARAVELAVNKYCSVRDSLREDIGVEWTIELRSA
jgi:putative redox protein